MTSEAEEIIGARSAPWERCLLVGPSLVDGGGATASMPERFVAATGGEVVLADATDGHEVRTLADLGAERFVIDLATTPTDVFVGTGEDTPVGCGVRRWIWRVGYDGTARRIARGENPAPDPDGRRLAFAAGDCETRTLGLGVVDLDTSQVRAVDLAWGREQPDSLGPAGWLDRTHVYLHAGGPDQEQIRLFVVDVDRDDKRRLHPFLVPDGEGPYLSVLDGPRDGRVPVAVQSSGSGDGVVMADERLRDPERLFRFPLLASAFEIAIDPSHRHVLFLAAGADNADGSATRDLWRWNVGDDAPTILRKATPYSSVAWVPE